MTARKILLSGGIKAGIKLDGWLRKPKGYVPPPVPPEYNTITGTPPLSFNSLDGSALTNYRMYGKAEDIILSGGSVGMGSSFNTTTTIRAHYGVFRIFKGKTYTFYASDYTNFHYAVNTSVNTYPFTFPYGIHQCDNSSGDWEISDITFTATRTGYLIINIGKPGDAEISLEDFDNVTMSVTEINAGVGDTTNNIFRMTDSDWSASTNGIQFKCVKNRFYAKGTATGTAISPIHFDLTGCKGTFYLSYNNNNGYVYADICKGGVWYGTNTAVTLTGNESSVYVAAVVQTGFTVTEEDYVDICVSTSNEFEPVAIVPLSLGEHDYSINLSSQLGITNGVADYIDFAAQKRYNADGTTEDVTLPTLTPAMGSNTISFGTAVQPSEVEIEGRIKPVVTGGG